MTAALLAAMSVFQASLGAGAPWGQASWCGKYPGKLPSRLRRLSAVAALPYGAGAFLLLWRKEAVQFRRLVGAACVLIGIVGMFANALSPAKLERIWAIWAAALTWSALPLARGE